MSVSLAKTTRELMRLAIADIPYVISSGVAVESLWIPSVERSATKPMQIQVAPAARSTTVVSRHQTDVELVCDVGVFVGLTAGNNDTEGERVQLMIDALIDGMIMAQVGEWHVMEAEQLLILSADHWRRLNVASSFVKFTLR